MLLVKDLFLVLLKVDIYTSGSVHECRFLVRYQTLLAVICAVVSDLGSSIST